MKPAQVGEDGAGGKGCAVVTAVGVKVGVKTGAEREAKGIGGGEGGPAERALGGDVHEVRARGAPLAQETTAGGQAGAEETIAGDWHAGGEILDVEAVGARCIQFSLTRAVEGHAVTAVR